MEQSWQQFKDAFLIAQELSIPQHKKLSTGGRKPAWLNKDLLVKLKDKKEKYRQWKQRWLPWEEYRNAIQMCRDGIRKGEVQLEFNFVSNMKNHQMICWLEEKGKGECTLSDK